MSSRHAWLLALLPLAAIPALHGEPVTVYECTEPDGIVTVRTRSPCPEGQRQPIRVVDPPPPVTLQPSFVAERRLQPQALPVLRAGPAGDDGQPAPEPVEPPALFQCVRYDGHRYFHDDDSPPSHCRPLQTVGIGGLPGIGAGQACERVHDECEPVPEDALCRAWETRVREAEFRWKFAGPGAGATSLRAAYEDLAATLEASTCSAAPD